MNVRKVLFLLLLVIVWNVVIIRAEWISGTQYYSQPAKTTLNLTWFECGLLYKYGIDNFMGVLDDFNFEGVVIQPFMLQANSTTLNATAQTGICEGFHSLCNRVDAYAEKRKDFVKFLFIGGSSYFDQTLVEQYVSRGYVMCIDDGTTNLRTLRGVLTYLRNQGAETLLVHGSHQSYRTVIEEGLVDYSSPCFYPFQPNCNWTRYVNEFELMCSWRGDKCKFLPGIQVFGGTPVQWVFPNVTQLEEMTDFLYNLNPFGLVWFLPHSGQSMRGELFDGFLDHPEVWDYIDTSSS